MSRIRPFAHRRFGFHRIRQIVLHRMPNGAVRMLTFLVAAVSLFPWHGAISHVSAQEERLHVRIDRLIEARAGGASAERATDAEFLRRTYLDLVGRIPSAEEARSFLESTEADKRGSLIDRLLADPRYADRMTDLFDVMLLERRGANDEWIKYLRTAFAENRPWDQMAREMLNPDAEDEATRGAAYFFVVHLERYGQNPSDVPGMVRDVGRFFLGIDVQCAQCHDHLFVDEYKQVDYQGLYAFVGQTFIRKDKSFPAVGENPLLTPVAFTSVFGGDEQRTGPRIPLGQEIAIPEIAKGDEYLEPPDRKAKTPGVLKFSPLKLLAETLPRGDNRLFARNIANRLWWATMGRGLVDPLDMQHADNLPSHPELLETLADKIAAHGFDIRWALRELMLSETYQRSSRLPDGLVPETADAAAPMASYRVALEKRLSDEQRLFSLLIATGEWPRLSADESKMSELRKRFEAALASPPQEPEVEVTPTVKAALFLSNDAELLSWFEPRDGNLVDRASRLESPGAIADELYVSLLSRPPTPDEVAEIEQFLSGFGEAREKGIGYLAWAAAASTEFHVNH
ncbi:MAG: DUF1549 domain-containing protein [Planctomycetaceae bacterium]